MNTYKTICFNKLLLYFHIFNIEDLDDVQGYNYCYLFKYFFGRSSFLTKIKSKFSLGT